MFQTKQKQSSQEPKTLYSVVMTEPDISEIKVISQPQSVKKTYINEIWVREKANRYAGIATWKYRLFHILPQNHFDSPTSNNWCSKWWQALAW